MSVLSGHHRRIQREALVGELQGMGMSVVSGLNFRYVQEGSAHIEDPESQELQPASYGRGIQCSHQGGELSARICLNDDKIGGQCDGTDCPLFKQAYRA